MSITVEIVVKRHNEWLKMAAYLGAESPEDLVQDMYLKLCEEPELCERIAYNDDVNKAYIFLMLRSRVVDAQRKLKNQTYDELLFDPCMSPDECEHDYEELMSSIKKTIDLMGDYDQMLLELHFVYKLSMREIEKRTGIPLHSIFNRLQNAKNIIRYANERKYKDYSQSVTEKETIARVGRYNSEDNGSNWY